MVRAHLAHQDGGQVAPVWQLGFVVQSIVFAQAAFEQVIEFVADQVEHALDRR